MALGGLNEAEQISEYETLQILKAGSRRTVKDVNGDESLCARSPRDVSAGNTGTND